jgi:hypothetical protein
LIAVVALAATSGCTQAKLARRAHLARFDLAGKTARELQECAGDPVRVEKSGNWQYLTYVSPVRNQERTKQCIATFIVLNGYVEDLQYENATGGLIGKNIIECLPIVDRCMPEMPNN